MVGVRDDNDKWGFIDKLGELVIPCVWSKIKNNYNEKNSEKEKTDCQLLENNVLVKDIRVSLDEEV